MNRTLALGIGNVLLSDEGAGIHALNFMQQHYGDRPGIQYLDGGTLSFTLASAIEEADDLLVFDAAQLEAEPGTVRCLAGKAMDHFIGTGNCSVHEVGLADLMDIARLTGSLPKNRALIGIQPATLGWGPQPSATVAASLPQAARLAQELLEEWSR